MKKLVMFAMHKEVSSNSLLLLRPHKFSVPRFVLKVNTRKATDLNRNSVNVPVAKYQAAGNAQELELALSVQLETT